MAAHPLINVELTVGLTTTLYQRLDAGALDLVFAKRRPGDVRGWPIRRERLAWMAHRAFDLDADMAAPLVLYPSSSHYREPGHRGAEPGWTPLVRRLHQRYAQRLAGGNARRLGHDRAVPPAPAPGRPRRSTAERRIARAGRDRIRRSGRQFAVARCARRSGRGHTGARPPNSGPKREGPGGRNGARGRPL